MQENKDDLLTLKCRRVGNGPTYAETDLKQARYVMTVIRTQTQAIKQVTKALKCHKLKTHADYTRKVCKKVEEGHGEEYYVPHSIRKDERRIIKKENYKTLCYSLNSLQTQDPRGTSGYVAER